MAFSASVRWTCSVEVEGVALVAPDEEGLSADCSDVDAVGGVEVGKGVVVEVDTPDKGT